MMLLPRRHDDEPRDVAKVLKPRLKKVIDAAREVNPDILIDYHSDGNVRVSSLIL